MGKSNWGIRACGVLLVWAIAAIASPAQTFTSLHSFTGSDGSNPTAPLIQANDGEFYGTTSFGGANSGCGVDKTTCGTVFKITSAGRLTTLHSFKGTDGFQPQGALLQANDGKFYGTTSYGGTPHTVGTVFTMTMSGKLKMIHDFDYTHGALPYAGLIQASNGMFYGTTPNGGSDSSGTIFKVTPNGRLTVLQNLCCSGTAAVAPLVQAKNGKLYGTALRDGTYSCGSVLKMTLSGALTGFDFEGSDGCLPWAALIQATDGSLYGTTTYGATGYGNVFKMTPGGTVTSLYTFHGPDGAGPTGALVQASDGNFYGTTDGGGTDSKGTIFEMTSEGALTTLYNFCSQSNCPDGANPEAGLVQGKDGKLYGTTEYGGASNDGTVFSLDLGIQAIGTHGKTPYRARQ